MKKTILFIILFLISGIFVFGRPHTVLDWRWRADDGNEQDANYLAAPNVTPTIQNKDNIRFRGTVMGGLDETLNMKLSYMLSTDTIYTEITATAGENAFVLSDSPYFTDGDSTYQNYLKAPSGYTFSEGGKLIDNSAIFQLNYQEGKYYEVEWCIKPTDKIKENATYYFEYPGCNNIGSLNTAVELPVELSAFSAKVLNSKVEIQWETVTEKNNYGFDIERMTAGKAQEDNTWEKIGFIAGNGNSNSVKVYSFTDKSPLCGKVKYRLKQIDFDGQYEYSKEIEVDYKVAEEYVLEQNYPNPFNPTTNISFSVSKDEFVSMKIYNTIGEEVANLVNQLVKAGQHEVTFNATNLPSGTYFCTMKAGKFIETTKLLLIK